MATAQQTPQPVTHIVFSPPVKLPVYSGKDDPNSWIERAKRTITLQQLTGQLAVIFLRDYLQGAAEVEVRQQLPPDPEALFALLQRVFRIRFSTPQVMREFFNRTQNSSESITDYSHALFAVLEKLTLDVSEREKLLRDQFSEGIRSVVIQRVLKRKVRDHPDITFLDLRDIAIDESEDISKSHVKEVEATLATSATVEAPAWATELIELTKQLLSCTNVVSNASVIKPAPRQPYACFYCSKVGHMIKNCKKRIREEKRSIRPVAATNSMEESRLRTNANKYKDEANEWEAKYHRRDNDYKVAEKNFLAAEAKLPDLQARLADAKNQRKHFETEYKRMRSDLSTLERQLVMTKSQLEEETLIRGEYENRLQSMKEDIAFKTQMFEQKLNEMRHQTTDEVDNRLKVKYERKLSETLHKLQEQHEDHVSAVRYEMEKRFEAQTCEIQEQVTRNHDIASKAQDELRKSRKRFDEISSDVVKVRAQKRRLDIDNSNFQRHLEMKIKIPWLLSRMLPNLLV